MMMTGTIIGHHLGEIHLININPDLNGTCAGVTGRRGELNCKKNPHRAGFFKHS